MKIEFNDPIIFLKKIFTNKETLIITLLSIVLLMNAYLIVDINLINKNMNDKIDQLGQEIQSSFDYLESRFELLIRLYR